MMAEAGKRHGVPAICSLFVPGLGQFIKGQAGRGIFCLIVVPVGYLFLVVPGLIFHIFTVVDAYRGPEGAAREGAPLWQKMAFALVVLLIAVMFLAVASGFLSGFVGVLRSAFAQETRRIEFYGKDSSRRGYMFVEPETGRGSGERSRTVDPYDRGSRRTGWGKVGPDGRLELFGKDGRRKGEGARGR